MLGWEACPHFAASGHMLRSGAYLNLQDSSETMHQKKNSKYHNSQVRIEPWMVYRTVRYDIEIRYIPSQ